MTLEEAFKKIKTSDVPPQLEDLKADILAKGIDNISDIKYDMNEYIVEQKGGDGVQEYLKKFGTVSRSEKDVVIYFAEHFCGVKTMDDAKEDSPIDNDDDDVTYTETKSTLNNDEIEEEDDEELELLEMEAAAALALIEMELELRKRNKK